MHARIVGGIGATDKAGIVDGRDRQVGFVHGQLAGGVSHAIAQCAFAAVVAGRDVVSAGRGVFGTLRRAAVHRIGGRPMEGVPVEQAA